MKGPRREPRPFPFAELTWMRSSAALTRRPPSPAPRWRATATASSGSRPRGLASKFLEFFILPTTINHGSVAAVIDDVELRKGLAAPDWRRRGRRVVVPLGLERQSPSQTGYRRDRPRAWCGSSSVEADRRGTAAGLRRPSPGFSPWGGFKPVRNRLSIPKSKQADASAD